MLTAVLDFSSTCRHSVIHKSLTVMAILISNPTCYVYDIVLWRQFTRSALRFCTPPAIAPVVQRQCCSEPLVLVVIYAVGVASISTVRAPAL